MNLTYFADELNLLFQGNVLRMLIYRLNWNANDANDTNLIFRQAYIHAAQFGVK